MRCGSGFAHQPYASVAASVAAQAEERQERLRRQRSLLEEEEERSAAIKGRLHAKFGDAIQLDL